MLVVDMLPLMLCASSSTCVTLERQLQRSSVGLKVNAVHASTLPQLVQHVFGDFAGMYPRRLPLYRALFCTMQPNAGDGGNGGGVGLGGDGWGGISGGGGVGAPSSAPLTAPAARLKPATLENIWHVPRSVAKVK